MAIFVSKISQNLHLSTGELMPETVATKNCFDFEYTHDIGEMLKHEAMILDKTGVVYLDSVIENTEMPEHTRNEMMWLRDKGILFNLTTPKEPTENLSNEFWWYKDFADEINLILKSPKKYKVKATKFRYSLMIRMTQLDTRAACLYLREAKNIDAMASFSHFCNSHKDLKPKPILNIAINHLPIPDSTVPWEQIFDFKLDPDSKSKFLALRNWMNETAKGKLTTIEIEQKLEYLIDQYKQHMKLHKMKTNTGSVQTLVTTSAEILGDLVSFKWGKAAEALFTLNNRKIALLEGELKAPGNEVAYIIKAQEKFN
jgi:hypothetical protein